MEQELELGEEVTHKEFYVGVNYYDGMVPYAYITESLTDISAEKVYKLKIPWKSNQ